jgi:hypothetical protein
LVRLERRAVIVEVYSYVESAAVDYAFERVVRRIARQGGGVFYAQVDACARSVATLLNDCFDEYWTGKTNVDVKFKVTNTRVLVAWGDGYINVLLAARNYLGLNNVYS